MYRPNQCTETDCTKTVEALGMCAGHLWRWALRCKHIDHDHDHAA